MKRYERKFIFDNGDLGLIYNVIKSYGYIEEYPKRKITSIYYDSTDFQLYKLSVNGVSDRKKIRIRFYNNLASNAILEYKYKSCDLGWKEYQDINVNDYTSSSLIQINNKLFNIDFFIPKYIDSIYEPNLLVLYNRIYFKSRFNQNRITLDTEIKFKRIFKSSKVNNYTNYINNINPVLELKYNKNTKPDLKIINYLSKYLSLNYTRFSKYCDGIELCF